MAKITFEEEHKVKVFIDGKHRGNIIRELGVHDIPVYVYYPRTVSGGQSKFGGDPFVSLEACKASLR